MGMIGWVEPNGNLGWVVTLHIICIMRTLNCVGFCVGLGGSKVWVEIILTMCE